MKEEIKNRIERLRERMRREGLEAYIVPSTDPHASEYTPEYWECRKWITGFTGSAGTAVITLHDAGLWTDSRYYLQAEEQLAGTGIRLMKDGMPDTPPIATWLGEVYRCEGKRQSWKVGICGLSCTVREYRQLESDLKDGGICLSSTDDLLDGIWEDRPSLPTSPISILPICYAGVPTAEKLSLIRQAYPNGYLLSALDEIAWTLNMRGADVHCNPVFVSYLLVGQAETILYVNPGKITDEGRSYLSEQGIEIRPYEQIQSDLAEKRSELGAIRLSPDCNFALFQAFVGEESLAPSPVKELKAIKNETEIKGFHEAMKRDGVAMVRFLMWVKQAVKSGKETEVSIDEKLYELRAAQKDFRGISFDTIAGYQDHGAIVHYEATPESAYTLKPEGFLLLDSGAQYLDGTTDITRTIALGPVTDEQRTDYTLVLKGFIALSQAEFPQGTCGTQLDVLARQFMWKQGINYKHGTGHGVGHYLNVHEGPHQIRMNHVPALLRPGMTVTNEPGIYKAGRHGIRTENTMLIVRSGETEFGEFYKFEPLTLCPIDKEPIRMDMMTPDETAWLNAYHQKVYDTLAPLLTPEEQAWLAEATATA